MNVLRVGLALVVTGCVLHGRSGSANDALEVEVLAIRSMLGAREETVAVDTLFAQPGQAPPAMTTVRRPARRHRALLDSIAGQRSASTRDPLRVRASAPSFDGATATISVTVDGPGARPGRRFYETVLFVLRRDGGRWVVHERTQLGIS
jgi:hypothetical protein